MSNDSSISLDNYAEEMYLGYSMAVIKDRALPFLSDGQKPVQRRILFAMRELGIKYNQPPKKSARVVGDVIGKYHPHGDSSVYEAMVRMSQNWNMRYPLVDGQGNFGSRDGDGAAAMRYTEARLTHFAEHILLDELKQGNTIHKPNYDNTITEPVYLPSRLNTLLLNGATGIAVGMACDIPSHNIREISDATIAAINNPKISHDEIMEILGGPDFPGGGQIIDPKEKINEVYSSGRGTLRVRARWVVEYKAKKQWQIVINELPPGTSTASVLSTITKLSNPPQRKDSKGKVKKLTQQQQDDKNLLNSILAGAQDESDKDNPVRLVLTPKSKTVSPEGFMESLLDKIGIEETVKVNFTQISIDGQATVKNIKEIITEWIEHRFELLTMRTKFALDKVLARLHILEGRVIALLNIDEVIAIIRESENPKADLMNKLNLTEIQAEDVLEIRLRQLAKLEQDKIEKEIQQLKKEQDRLEGLLNSKVKMNNLMKNEIQEDTKLFEDERRTLIKEATPSNEIKSKLEDKILDEPITVIITDNYWIAQRRGHEIDISTTQLRDGDSVAHVIEGNLRDTIAIISESGRVFNVRASDIPNVRNGFVHLARLIDLGSDKIATLLFIGDEKEAAFTYNSAGYGFVFRRGDLLTRSKAGKAFINVTKGARIFDIIKYEKDSDKNFFYIRSSDDRLLCFPTKEFDEMSELLKGKGYQLISLPGDIELKELFIDHVENVSIKISGEKMLATDEKLLSKRARRGTKLDKRDRVNRK